MWLCVSRTRESEIGKDPETHLPESLSAVDHGVCDLVPSCTSRSECSQGNCRELAQFSVVKLSVYFLSTRKLPAKKYGNRLAVEVLAGLRVDECFFAGAAPAASSNGNSFLSSP